MSSSVIQRLSTSVVYKGYGESETQHKTDEIVSRFTEEACDYKTLLPLMAGGLAYRFTRGAVMSANLGHVIAMPLRPLSVVLGLGSEVTAFEFTNRTLQTVGANLVFAPENGRSQGSPLQQPIHNLWSWSGPGGWRDGLLTSAITFLTLKSAGFLARDQNIILQHTLQSTAMVAGHQAAGLLGLTPKPETGLADQLLHAEVMNFQMATGLSLVHTLSPRLSLLEKAFDFSLSTLSKPPPKMKERLSLSLFQDGLKPVLLGPSLPEVKKIETLDSPLLKMSGESDGQLPSPEEAKTLEGKYRGFFPSDFLPRSRQSGIVIKAALETPCTQPLFHERLLEAYAKTLNRGNLEETYTALAIQDLFTFSDPSSNTGSFQNIIHQTLIRRILADPDSTRRASALAQLFQAMERGLHPSDLESIFSTTHYGDDLKASPSPEYPPRFTDKYASFIRNYWRSFSSSERTLLLNAIYELSEEGGPLAAQMLMQTAQARNHRIYSDKLIERVLDHARTHPFGRVMVRRMIQIFRAEDMEAKLKEMLPEETESPSRLPQSALFPLHLKDTGRLSAFFECWRKSILGTLFRENSSPPSLLMESLEAIHTLSAQGFNKDEIARRINGSRHTAYLSDLRLARKIVTMNLKVYSQIHEEASVRAERRGEFQKIVLKDLNHLSAQPQGDDYLKILTSLEMSPPDWILKKITDHELKIEVLDSATFEGEDYGLSGAKKHLARFVKGNPEMGLPHLIQIREIPEAILKSFLKPARVKAFAERLFSLVHEIGHYKIWTGLDEEIQGYPEGPLPMAHRHQVLASEIMANLEEQPLRTRYWEIEPWIIASRLGVNFPLYVRLTNEHLYYRSVNEKLMEGLKGLP